MVLKNRFELLDYWNYRNYRNCSVITDELIIENALIAIIVRAIDLQRTEVNRGM